jgi:aminoglycoside phosphotransferase (APT) family kinase protein
VPEKEGPDSADVVARAIGPHARVLRADALTQGASRRTTALVVDVDGVERRFVLQQGRAESGRVMTTEAELMVRAVAAGVPAPVVVAASDDPEEPGAPYTLTEHIDGETRPHRILADPALAGVRAGLARRCGEVLAAVHRTDPGGLGLAIAYDPVRTLRDQYDAADAPVPTFELAFRELAGARPPARPAALVHGDFRMGNMIVSADAPGGLAAVLDWELAHVGDPLEDLGWLCTKAWRFRQRPVVGGFGEVDDLLAGYTGAGGAPVAPGELRWWTVYGTLRWGVICLTMLDDHLRGAVRSVDRVAIGRRVAEQEWDLLDLLDAGMPA